MNGTAILICVEGASLDLGYYFVCLDYGTERHWEHSFMIATTVHTTTGLFMQGRTRRCMIFMVDADRQLQAKLVQQLTHALSIIIVASSCQSLSILPSHTLEYTTA